MDLIEAMRTESSRCKRLLYGWAIPLGMSLFAAALAGCFPDTPEWLTRTLAVYVLVAQIALFGLRMVASVHQEQAEDVRRMAMLQDGLGNQPSSITLARLQESIGKFEHLEPSYLGPYYSSQKPQGPRRMLEIMAECAFFTGGIARRVVQVALASSVVGLVAVLLALVIIVLFGAASAWTQVLAKVVILTVSFLAVGDFAASALAFKSLARSADAVLQGCDQALGDLPNTEASSLPILALFSAYTCAVGKAPPLPAFAYRRYQERLNDAWRDRIQGGERAEPASTTAT
ncbi:MAG: hypothetical protein HYZ53_20785 [Planctomycetes bacterium]|nr:hypothetical protein [Planctomycetota bacterium]